MKGWDRGGEGDHEVLLDRNLFWLEKKSGFKGLPGRLAAYQARPDEADQVAPGDQADQATRRLPGRPGGTRRGALAWRGAFPGACSITWETRIIGQVATR